ncbi:MAG: ABC transporter ATP-binding protein, partial [Lachnospiraceae bacterium]|nr:ABC transporter ATP-binding protein [Lachnospiraceae bacterium]
EVLKNLELSVPEHSIFGFIGKNGAGKTTTMKIILGLLQPDDGAVYVAGTRVTYGQSASNHFVGYLPDVPEFYPFMTAPEYLTFCGEITGMPRSEIAQYSRELLELVGLGGETHRIKGFSRGMKQRLGIAQALLNRPRLLICDEPTSALDPVGRKEILDILSSVRAHTTVLFSTHILSDVERICTDAAFLKDGVVSIQGTLADIKAAYRSKEYRIELELESDIPALIDTFEHCKKLEKNQVTLRDDGNALYDVLQYITARKIPIQKIERMEPSLEDLFMEVVEK